MIGKTLPVYCDGTVIKGFGRGSKQLGIPTANYSTDVVSHLSTEFKTGVYFGWAQVDSGLVYKMVMSVGWNPYYKNKTKSIETHIMHQFNEDFYGSRLKTCVVAFIRQEKDFETLHDLITTIKSDIDFADKMLNSDEYLKYKSDNFFTSDFSIAVSSSSSTTADGTLVDLCDIKSENGVNYTNRHT